LKFATMSLRLFCASALLAMVSIKPGLAQVDTATLNGTISDSSGAVITNAKVSVVSRSTGESRDTITNRDGIYIIPKLPVGQYDILFSSQHFQGLTFEGVKLQAGQNVTLDARLSLATTKTQVEVKAAKPLLERNTADISATVGSEEIDNLPTNGRNWANLLVLAPLAIDDGGGDQRSIRFAGRARDDNNYRMDGIDATGIREQAQKIHDAAANPDPCRRRVPRQFGVVHRGIWGRLRRTSGSGFEIWDERFPRRSF
jgi:hypothetical protein